MVAVAPLILHGIAAHAALQLEDNLTPYGRQA